MLFNLTGWLTGWNYRKSFLIKGTTAGAQTGYQICIVVHYGSGTDWGEDVYLNGKCKADFGDVRFTDSDGVTELSYWMEEKVDGDYAIFWVKIPSIPASPDTTAVYLYYGNPDATTTSNGDNTFIVFDDWEDGQDHVDTKWTVTYSTPTPLVGEHSVITDEGKHVLRMYAFDRGSRVFKSIQTIPDGFAARIREKMIQGGTANVFSFRMHPRFVDCNNFLHVWYYNFYQRYQINKKVGGTVTELGNTGNNSYPWSSEYNNYHIIEAKVKGTTFKVERDGTEILSSTNGWDATDKSVAFGLAQWVTGGANVEVYFDWILVRKWVDPEPTIEAWGSEEVAVTVTLIAQQFPMYHLAKLPIVKREALMEATLTAEGSPLEGKTINFYHKRSAEAEWIDDGTDVTDSSGKATKVIIIDVPETYDFKASFAGDETYTPSEASLTDEYVDAPVRVRAQMLVSKVEGGAIKRVAKDFPEILLKEGKAEELRSKFE